MYKQFFGFKEKPFKQAPNPEYLFLSKSHGETLTHLIFAISQGEGFVVVTGEDGTGKTTLCRALLSNLDESVKAAYISKPKLDALQFLRTINDEFLVGPTPGNTKDIIAKLNGYLIKKRAEGKKVLLLIDEAQDLPLEVMEQHSLFSSPETTQEKLLQIILVGQPQLKDMLSSPQLKQLGQRITKNCKLSPLTFLETEKYIRHRISHASHKTGPRFDKASCRAIYEYSQGIPRLINIGCDLTLQNAFNSDSSKITGAITREAINELTRKKPARTYQRLNKASGLVILSAVLVPLVIVLFYFAKVQPPETAFIDKTVTRTKLLAISGPINSEADKLKTPAKPPAISQSEPDENISEDMDLHLVHVGTFETDSQAKWRLKSLKSLGFPSFMFTSKSKNGKTVYEVIAGKYQSYDLAKEASLSLSQKGQFNIVAKAKDFQN